MELNGQRRTEQNRTLRYRLVAGMVGRIDWGGLAGRNGIERSMAEQSIAVPTGGPQYMSGVAGRLG